MAVSDTGFAECFESLGLNSHLCFVDDSGDLGFECIINGKECGFIVQSELFEYHRCKIDYIRTMVERYCPGLL